jgi:hypothetical protein
MKSNFLFQFLKMKTVPLLVIKAVSVHNIVSKSVNSLTYLRSFTSFLSIDLTLRSTGFVNLIQQQPVWLLNLLLLRLLLVLKDKLIWHTFI